MAKEKPNEKRNEEGNETPAKPKGRLKPIMLVAGLMLVEGVGIFALMTLMHPAPESALAADEGDADDPFNLEGRTELVICDVTAFNKKEGSLYVYSIELSALVKAEDAESVQRFVEARELSIKDRLQAVIRAADPRDLDDPSLETLKRQLLFELNNLLGGKELICEILISRMLQSRTHL